MIKIESFNSYKNNYEYHILSTIAIADKVKHLTLSESTATKADKMRNNVLNAERGSSKLDEIYFSYTLLLMNFVSLNGLYEERVIFDHLYNAVRSTKGFQGSMDSQLLKNIVDEIR